MQTITKTITVYELSELSEDAQQMAHNDYLCNGVDDYWCDELRDSLYEFTRFFGISVSDGRLGTIVINYATLAENDESGDDVEGLRLWKWLQNNDYLPDLSGNYPFTGVCYDEDLLDPLREFMWNPQPGVTWLDLMRECIDAYESAWRAEEEYHASFEYFANMCECNEWQFTENGKLHW